MADKVIQLSVKVNAETGQLDVLGAKFKGVGESAKAASGSFKGLGQDAKSLLASFLPFATAGGIVAFFTQAVRGAEEENQALRRLQFALEASGQSWDKNKQGVLDWAAAIQQATRFSDSDAFDSVEKLVRVTGNLTQAQRGTQLAMGLSTQSGQQLSSTLQTVTDLINGNERALIQVRREFGSFVGNAKTTQEALDALNLSFGDAAIKEQGLTRESLGLKNQFNDFADRIGNALAPAISGTISLLSGLFTWIDRVAQAFATMGAAAMASFQGIAEAAQLAFKGRFQEAKAAVQDISKTIQDILLESASQMEQIEAQKTTNLQAHLATRGQIYANQSQQDVRQAEEAAQKIAQMEGDLDKQILAIKQETLAQKQALLSQEISMQQAKIEQEVKNETKKKELLAKLNILHQKRETELIKAEVQMKTAAALQIADISIQALTVLNNMSELKSQEDARRAKFILALEKSIAIARVWAAEASKGVVGIGIAAASTALIIAQFAQQSRAIDQARSASASGRQEFKMSTELPGGTSSVDQIFKPGEQTAAGAPLAGGAAAPAASGGGTTIIQLPSIVVNVYPDSLDLSDIRTVLRRLGEEVQRETIDGVVLARRLDALATKNSGLAV